MPPQDWEKYFTIVNKNLERLARLESRIEENHDRVMMMVQGVKEDVEDINTQVKDMHEVLYKNGLTSKVEMLWSKKDSIEKIDSIWDRIRLLDKVIVGVVTALLTAIALYFFAAPDKSAHELIEHLKKIEQKLDANNKNPQP